MLRKLFLGNRKWWGRDEDGWRILVAKFRVTALVSERTFFASVSAKCIRDRASRKG